MDKCNVCGKTTLLPERFGNVNICKICFLKMKGPLWKYVFDKKESVEKHQKQALKFAGEFNCTPDVISAINDFFVCQLNNMKTCICCGQQVQTLYSIGETAICKKCYQRIDTDAWRQTEYVDNEEVQENRQKILTIATKHGYPDIVVSGINAHFDKRIDKNLLCVVDGRVGQKIRVYRDRVLLLTEESFNIDEMARLYRKATASTHPKESMLDGRAVASAAFNLVRGRYVQAGIGLATSFANGSVSNMSTSRHRSFKSIKGSFVIDYTVFDQVEYQGCGDNEVGFLRFINKKHSDNSSEDIVFFFDSNGEKVKTAYQNICYCIGVLKEKEENKRKEQSVQAAVPQYVVQSSAADELLKYKQLLDMGAITQEEYDAKKKELLSM